MANMSIGGHTLLSNPSEMTVLVKDKIAAEILTYSSVAFFDWGRAWPGKPITMKWDYLPATEFDTLDGLLDTVGDMLFDPQDGKTKTYDVWLKRMNGEYYLDPSSNAEVFRRNVELVMVIKEQN
jgi:hypothetical protein